MAINGADTSGVWKWISAILVAIMLAGIPSIVEAFRAPTQGQYDFIRERQELVLQRLAVLDQEVLVLQQENAELAARVRELESPSRR